MAGSERASNAGRRVPGRGAKSAWATTHVDERDEKANGHDNRRPLDAALLRDFGMISRFGSDRQAEVVEQLQHSHGNAYVARALAELSQGATGLQRAPGDAKAGFVPTTTAKPRIPNLKVGETQEVDLDITNASSAPKGTKFHWDFWLTDQSPVGDAVGFHSLTGQDSPHAKVPVIGHAPGNAHGNSEVKQSGGPTEVPATGGPQLSIYVKTPRVAKRTVYILPGGKSRPETPEGEPRLHIGDVLYLKWEFDFVDPSVEGKQSFPGGKGFDHFRHKEAGKWTGTTYEQKFEAWDIGPSEIEMSFLFDKMDMKHAVTDTITSYILRDSEN